MTMGIWVNQYYCVSCAKQLTKMQLMYSDGRCPLCGHKGPSAGTVVDVDERAARVAYPPWWAFWRMPEVLEVLDE